MASNRIKGITIEIDGNVTKLQKALDSTNKDLKTTQSNLRDVNKLLKLDTGNVDLLKQKQKLLNNAIKDVNDRLAKEKEALKQLKEGDQTPEVVAQMEALQRQIADDEAYLKKLKGEAKDFGSVAKQQFKAAGDKVKEFGTKLSDAGATLSKKVTAPIVGLATVAVKTTADFDTSMSKVSAVSGATGDDLAALRDKAREMGAQTKFSASEAADAMNYMAMAGWKTDDMLGGISGVMSLAAASGEDLATTSDILTDALTAFGKSAEDAGKLADIMAAASSNANTNVAMMGETFKYAAPVAGALGFTMEDTAVAIGLMANAGIKSSQAGTALRAGMTNLVKPSKQAAEAMERYGIEATNADGSMKSLREIMEMLREKLGGLNEAEQAAAAGAIFGKNAMSGWLAVVNGSPEDFAKLQEAIDGSDGAAEQMALTMQDNLGGQLTILMSQLQELAISFGEILMPYIREATTFIQGLVDKFNSLDEETKKTITVIAAVAAAIGPVLFIGGKLVKGVGNLIGIVGKAVGALQTVVTFLGGPLTIAIAAIIAIGVLLWKNWDTIKEKATAVKDWVVDKWNGIKEGMNNAIGAVKQFTSERLGAIKQAYQDAGGGIKGVISGAMTAVKQYFRDGFNVLNQLTGGKLGEIKQKFTDKFNAIKDFVKGVIEKIKGFFSFNIELPHIKLPHFSIQPSGWKLGDLLKGEIPHLGIEWYKRAYDNPVLFTSPTVVSTPGGLKGFGDGNGGELVYGRDSLMRDIRAASLSESQIYNAMVAALQATDMKVVIGNREFGRILREQGAI